MNIKTIIASLVLGSSSVAMAAPSISFQPTAEVSSASTATVHVDHSRYTPGTRAIVRPAPQPVQRGWFSGGWRGGWQRPVVVQPVGYRPVYQAPVTLASELSFRGADRKFITVGAHAGQFRKLELNAAGGRTFIKQVYVQFADGQEQVIRDLDRTLSRGERLTIDLDGGRRTIRRIVVYGTEINNGWRRAPGAFSVTAA